MLRGMLASTNFAFSSEPPYVPYPQVIATSVVRSAHQGESHGGVYLVDLAAESFEQVVDWNTTEIEWLGRGHDRGLRGIAFWRGRTYIAASDALLVYDRGFRLEAAFRNRYLRHGHEIARDGATLWLTSTGFDTLLAFDLERQVFSHGWCLRLDTLGQLRRALTPTHVPRPVSFDPTRADGPAPGDTVHLNTVVVDDGEIFCSGTRLAVQMRVTHGNLFPYARIPLRTHNTQPYLDGILMHNTAEDHVLHARRDGTPLERWALPRYDDARLEYSALPADHARQAFGRGLCVTHDGLIIAGSSPSTISVYRHGETEPQRSVQLTMDVRNAIHGLEVYPP